jgi:fluoride ion exporter CrcB/FEX
MCIIIFEVVICYKPVFLVQMNTTNYDTVITGVQFGLLGCLSTVSTLAAEFNAMRESKQPWKAYAYVMVTICISFSFGILLYYIPISRM